MDEYFWKRFVSKQVYKKVFQYPNRRNIGNEKEKIVRCHGLLNIS